MTEAIEQEYEIEVIPENEIEGDVEENLSLPKKADVMSGLYYAGGGIVGYIGADLASGIIETKGIDFFTEHPKAWWILPIAKVGAGIIVLKASAGMKGAAMKKFVTGVGIGIFANVGKDLLVALDIHAKVGIQRDITVQVT